MRTSLLMATTAQPGWDAHLASVFSQSTPASEVVVVVDRQTSRAERRDLSASQPRVRFVFNENNVGLTRSLNVAIAVAEGDVLFRLDDDDICHPTRFERQLAVLREHGGDIVCSFALGRRAGSSQSSWLIDHAVDDAALKHELARRNVIVHSTLGFTRDAIDRLGGYDTHFRYAQDYALHLRAIRQGLRFAVVAEPLVTRVYSDDAITVKKRKQQIMYSSAARMLHAAELGDVEDFRKAARRSDTLLAVPNALRELRRLAFGLVGRGA